MGDGGSVATADAHPLEASSPRPLLLLATPWPHLFIFQTFLVPILAPHLAQLQAVCRARASCVVSLGHTLLA